jgi:hypothetical protein
MIVHLLGRGCHLECHTWPESGVAGEINGATATTRELHSPTSPQPVAPPLSSSRGRTEGQPPFHG